MINKKEIVRKNELRKGESNMDILPSRAETLLKIILGKYDGNKDMSVRGDDSELPGNMQVGLKDIFDTLKLHNCIGEYDVDLCGWEVILNQEGIEYFNKKGMRVELFEELSDSEKDLLREIISVEMSDGDISTYLAEKVNNANSKDIIRGIIGNLKSNGLLDVLWADNTVYNAILTQPGRTYFEREEKYFKRMKESANNTYNIENIHAYGSNFVIGDVINSSLTIDSSLTRIENRVEQECAQEDKKEIKELLEEVKEILDNIQKNGYIEQRKNFFEKLTEHVRKYGWLYSEMVNLIGPVVIGKIGGK